MNTESKKWHATKPNKLPCACANDFQDKVHGKGVRVHNAMKTSTGVGYRCTVCGNEKD